MHSLLMQNLFLMVSTVKEMIFVSKSVEGLSCSTESEPVASPLTIVLSKMCTSRKELIEGNFYSEMLKLN